MPIHSQMNPKTKRILAIFIVATSSVILLLVIFAAFPLRLDELLLTNDEFCCINSENFIHPSGYMEAPVSGLNLELASTLQKQVVALFRHSVDFVVWKLAAHLWNRHNSCSVQVETIKHYNSTQSASTGQLFGRHNYSSNIPRECSSDADSTQHVTSGMLHPMCQTYRDFRSRLHIQHIWIPWNWYYSCRLQLNRLSLRSAINKIHRDQRPHFVSKQSCILSPSLGEFESTNEQHCNNTHCKNIHQPPNELPPSLEIESLDVSFQSWTRPVISIHAKDVVINLVIQKGLISLPLSFPKKDIDSFESKVESQAGQSGGFSFLIGDMAIQDAVELLPKPPEREGIYPMIGTVNVSNVAVYLWERSSKKGRQQQQSLHLLTKLKIPDEFFVPIVHLTSTNQPNGIDRFHFPRLLESEFASAFRRHLCSEAEEALRHSWTMAAEFSDHLKEQGNKVQDGLQNLVHKTQQLYVDRWIELGAQIFHEIGQNLWKGWVNNTAPLTNAFEAWVQDMKTAISEPMASPLKIVMIYHWNKIFDIFNKQDALVDKANWNLNDLKYAFNEMKSTIQRVVAKSKDDIDRLVTTCEGEIKDMWLSWHLQFLPDLN